MNEAEVHVRELNSISWKSALTLIQPYLLLFLDPTSTFMIQYHIYSLSFCYYMLPRSYTSFWNVVPFYP